MRAIRRWLAERRADRGIAARREAVRHELEAHFGTTLTLHPSGARGRDSVYRVAAGAVSVGMLRLVNPHRRRAPPAPDLPYRWLEDGPRLDREWTAYATASASGLAPKPLWRSTDALVCEHLAGARLHQLYEEAPERFWPLNRDACLGLARLHALGLVHMDASLANTILGAGPGELQFIDFEYAPAAHVDAAQAILYDHLRLVESALKTLPVEEDARAGPWLEALDAVLPAEARNADARPLRAALVRLWRRPSLLRAIGAIAPGVRS